MRKPAFPVLRWLSLLWIAVWIPAYYVVWGPSNFLLLCDIAVILTAIGLWTESALLLSSQAVSSIVVDFLWCLDFLVRATLHRHVIGGTEYMWDPQYPLWVRLLSFFHLFLPFVLLSALERLGYDRRAPLLQVAIAAPLLAVSRFFPSGKNLNFAFTDPLFHRAWGPAPVHVLVILAGLVVILYLPTHLALARSIGHGWQRQ